MQLKVIVLIIMYVKFIVLRIFIFCIASSIINK